MIKQIISASHQKRNSFLAYEVLNHIENKSPSIVFDLDGSLTAVLLQHLHTKKDILNDFVLFSFWDTALPIGVSLFDQWSIDDVTQRIETLVRVFKDYFGEETFWPRIQDYFRHISWLMIQSHKKKTMLQCTRFLTDDKFAKLTVDGSDDVYGKHRYTDVYMKQWDDAKHEMIPFFYSKFSQFIHHRMWRHMFWQTQDRMQLKELLATWKTIVFNMQWLVCDSAFWSIVINIIYWLLFEQKKHLPAYTIFCADVHKYLSHRLYELLYDNSADNVIISYPWIDVLSHFSQQTLEKDYLPLVFNACGETIVFDLWIVDQEKIKTYFPFFVATSQCASLTSSTQQNFSFPELPVMNIKKNKGETIKQMYLLKYGVNADLLEKDIRFQLHK